MRLIAWSVATAAAYLPMLLAIGAVAGCRNERARNAASIDGAFADSGRAVIVRYGCGTCHVIPGVRRATGKTGPPLTDYAERVYIAGAVLNTPENLVRWIRFPQLIEPGTVMPALGLTEREADHAAAYLYSLGTPDAAGPPHLLPKRWLQR